MKQLPRKMLTEYEKQANSDWWKMCIMNTKEGGTITWKDKGYIFTIKNSQMVAPHKSAYLDLMKNTYKEFFDKYVAKR